MSVILRHDLSFGGLSEFVENSKWSKCGVIVQPSSGPLNNLLELFGSAKIMALI
jgi:hypothetical protein